MESIVEIEYIKSAQKLKRHFNNSKHSNLTDIIE